MGSTLSRADFSIRGRSGLVRAATRWSFIAALSFSICACHSILPVDTKPLDDTGMSYDSIRQLKSLGITTPEVAQLATARDAGISDGTCIALVRISHDRKQPFDAGEAAAGLFRAQTTEGMILELARLNELGLPSGEFEAMRLAGLSEATVLAVARRRASNEPVLSGASLAGLKNAGMRESTLLELARRGIPDSRAAEISYLRRHGESDSEILERYTGS